jgi:radical SAM protein with 4Fe4S-binding SPASM domain
MTVEVQEHVFLKENAAGLAVQRSRLRDPEAVLTANLGDRYTAYRRMWRQSENFQIVPDWPLHLDVDTNYSCNLRCAMCPLGVPGREVPYGNRLLDKKLYARVITEGAARGLCAVRLGLTGEPLLRGDILEFVDLARRAGVVDIMLITNGLLLTPEISRRLIDAGLTRLQVSLDAVTAETYARLRRGGDFETVMNNVAGFLAARDEAGSDLPLLRVSFVRTAVNAPELDTFEDYWQDRADYVAVQEYADLVGTPESQALIPADRREVMDFRCPDPFQRLSLFVNGDLFGCCADHGREYPWGNAHRDEVGRVWRSRAAENLRDLQRQGRWYDHPACRKCGLASVARLPNEAAREKARTRSPRSRSYSCLKTIRPTIQPS